MSNKPRQPKHLSPDAKQLVSDPTSTVRPQEDQSVESRSNSAPAHAVRPLKEQSAGKASNSPTTRAVRPKDVRRRVFVPMHVVVRQKDTKRLVSAPTRGKRPTEADLRPRNIVSAPTRGKHPQEEQSAENASHSAPAHAIRPKNARRQALVPKHLLNPRKKQTAKETDAMPALTVIDARAERRARLSHTSIRLIPMATLGIVVYTALIIAFVVLERFGILNIPFSYSAGIEAYALSAILVLGLIPILTSSILILAFRPTSNYVLGLRSIPTSYVSAPIAGFLTGLLLWCITQLISTFDVAIVRYLKTPEIWNSGLFYFGKSPRSALTVLLVAVLLPATSVELLARGLIQQALTTGRSYAFAGIASSLLFALPYFDIDGLTILVIGGIFSFWIRLRTDSLIASALATASFSLAMITSQSIFTSIGQMLFHVPLIELSKIRVFLLMCSFILVVLLLIPTALIKETGKRIDEESKRFDDHRRGRKRKKKRDDGERDAANKSTRYALYGITSLSVVVLATLVILTR